MIPGRLLLFAGVRLVMGTVIASIVMSAVFAAWEPQA